jgi:hypothetical protein
MLTKLVSSHVTQQVGYHRTWGSKVIETLIAPGADTVRLRT